MITIFHGENQLQSRTAYNTALESLTNTETLRLDHKESNPEIISNFLNTGSLFATPKAIALTNLFSVSKPSLDKITKILQKASNLSIYIWQDKKLNLTQLKSFPRAKVLYFALSKNLFTCLYAAKPHNLNQFIKLYRQTLETEPYDLFAYLLKNNLRKQLESTSKFPIESLKRAFLNLIELDFLNKSGQLTIPKEIALERIMINLLK